MLTRPGPHSATTKDPECADPAAALFFAVRISPDSAHLTAACALCCCGFHFSPVRFQKCPEHGQRCPLNRLRAVTSSAAAESPTAARYSSSHRVGDASQEDDRARRCGRLESEHAGGEGHFRGSSFQKRNPLFCFFHPFGTNFFRQGRDRAKNCSPVGVVLQ